MKYNKSELAEIRLIEGVMVQNHESCISCDSSDGMSVYQKEYKGDIVHDAFCYACAKPFSPNELDLDKIPVKDVGEIKAFNAAKVAEITALASRGWRDRRVGLPVSELYGVKAEISDTGVMLNRYYPARRDGEITGYLVRNCLHKDFYSVGSNTTRGELFGQHLFPAGGRRLVIAGGQEDAMSAYQMLKTPKYTTPCVSSNVGEGNLIAQIKNNFDYVRSFKEIILMLDNDEAGRKATAEVVRLFDAGKVKVWSPSDDHNDVNDYLRNKEEDKFMSLYFNTQVETPAGIIESHDDKLWDAIIERAKAEKIGLPPFAEELEEMLRGGPALGEITVLTAASSVGKTSILTAFTHHWIYNAPYKFGIISLESDLGEYAENLLSLEIKAKLANLTDEEKLAVLAEDSVKERYKTLTQKENGESRFILLDHQGSVIDDDLKHKIEYMVKVLGCKGIIIDPLTLGLSGQKNEGVDMFNAWYVRFVKKEQIAAFNVLHLRKNQVGAKANSRGAEISEEDISGAGSFFQTAMNIWLFMRDKYSDDPIARNTTKVVQSKARRTGLTGTAGYWYYNNTTGLFEKGVNPDKIDTRTEEEELKMMGAYNDIDPEDFQGGGY